MKRFLLAAALLIPLGGCAQLQSLIGPSASQDALQAARITITTYADVYQPAVITYGRLPVCAEGGPALCKVPATFAKLKAADAAVAATLKAAQDVLEGSVSDGGEISAAISAIQQAEAAIGASGAMAANSSAGDQP